MVHNNKFPVTIINTPTVQQQFDFGIRDGVLHRESTQQRNSRLNKYVKVRNCSFAAQYR